MKINIHSLLIIASCFLILTVEVNADTLDDKYKLEILGNVGMKNLTIRKGDQVAYLADWNKCTPIDGCDYEFSLLFPDNYIGSSNFLYVFSINAGKFDMNRQNVSGVYYEVDLGTSVTGEYLTFYSTIFYNFFRGSLINLRPGIGIGFGQASFSGDYYLTDTITNTNTLGSNTLGSKCWNYTHTNKSFEEISKYCQKNKIQKNLQSLGFSIHLDLRIKYFGIKIDAYLLEENLEQDNSVFFGYVNQGFYVLIPF